MPEADDASEKGNSSRRGELSESGKLKMAHDGKLVRLRQKIKCKIQ
jgi:hypothetical protein